MTRPREVLWIVAISPMVVYLMFAELAEMRWLRPAVWFTLAALNSLFWLWMALEMVR